MKKKEETKTETAAPASTILPVEERMNVSLKIEKDPEESKISWKKTAFVGGTAIAGYAAYQGLKLGFDLLRNRSGLAPTGSSGEHA